MDTRYSEDGDPYSPAERRAPLVRPWTWIVGAVAVLGMGAYAWRTAPGGGAVPVIDERKTLMAEPHWNGYAPAPAPKLQPAAVQPDTQLDAVLRQMRALQDENATNRELLQQLLSRPEPEREAEQLEETSQKTQAAPTANATATKPARPRHRDMGYMAFSQAEEKAGEGPLYTLAPGDAKIPCVVEAQQNSDIESVSTVKVHGNVWDTDSRRRLLIPQGATILVKYHSGGLVYGNARLPEHSTILTLPNGTTVDLNQEPVMDQIGQAGLVSSVDNHYWRSLPAVLIQGVLRGSQQTISTTNPLAGAVTGSATQYGQRITQPYVDTRPTIRVDAGEECLVILTRAIKLPEYKEVRARER